MVLERHTPQIRSELFHKPDLTMKKLVEARGSFLTLNSKLRRLLFLTQGFFISR